MLINIPIILGSIMVIVKIILIILVIFALLKYIKSK